MNWMLSSAQVRRVAMLVVASGSIGLGVQTATAQQVVLDFEAVPAPLFPGGDVDVPSPFHEDGFIVCAPDGNCETGAFLARWPRAGETKSLWVENDRQFFVVVEETNGTFDVTSFDIATKVDDHPAGFDIFGLRADGTVVGIVHRPLDPDDGAPTYSGFATMQPAGFTNLVAFVVANRGSDDFAQLDNIVINNIHHGSGFPTGEVTLDFENVATPNEFVTNVYGRFYYKDGYMIADVNEDVLTLYRFLGPEATGYAGSKALNGYQLSNDGFTIPEWANGDDVSFSITRVDHQPFTIESIDVASLQPYQVDPIGVGFLGNFIQHIEPNPESATPTFVRYPLGAQPGDLCDNSFGGSMVQFDNIRLTTTPACPADFNGDHVRDVADLFGYINAWLAKAPSANFNHDAAVDVADLFGYINAWLAGC